MTAQLKVHPAADAFPLMDERRYAELRDDIREHGLRQPITICDGMVLDGRNRYRACVELGIAPKTVVYEGDPWACAWSLNGQRRDLVAEQRYLIWKFCHENSEAFQAEKQRIAEEANAKRSKATKAQPREADGTMAAKPVSVQTVHRPAAQAPRPERVEKAKASKTNAGAVARGDALAERRPDLAEKVRKGEVKPAEAYRQMKRDTVAATVEALPADKHRVIYADPPWQYSDQRVGVMESTAAADHYPTMSVAELSALDVRSIAADDCVLFCWATFPLLPDALEVVRAWGFKYKTAFVWAKGRPNFGHYHDASAELLLVCTRGSATPEADVREAQIQNFARGKHSAKPEQFRALIDRLYPHGARIELFRRGAAPDGWKVWGNESV